MGTTKYGLFFEGPGSVLIKLQHRILLVVLLFPFACLAQHFHTNMVRGKDATGFVLIKYSEDSAKISETHFSDSLYRIMHGKEMYFWKSGQIREVNFYQHNKLVRQEFFYENGKPELVKVFSDQYRNYIYQNYWDSTGVHLLDNGEGELLLKTPGIIERGEMKNGQRNGRWAGWSVKDKKLLFTEKYESNRLLYGKGLGKRKYFYRERKVSPVLQNRKETETCIADIRIKSQVHVLYVDLEIDEKGNILSSSVRAKDSGENSKRIVEVFTKYSKWKPGKEYGIPVKSSVTYPVRIGLSEE